LPPGSCRYSHCPGLFIGLRVTPNPTTALIWAAVSLHGSIDGVGCGGSVNVGRPDGATDPDGAGGVPVPVGPAAPGAAGDLLAQPVSAVAARSVTSTSLGMRASMS